MPLKQPRNIKGYTYAGTTNPSTQYSVQGGDTWFDENLEYGKVYDDNLNRWVPLIDGKGYGYVCGGYTTTYISSIERIDFSYGDGNSTSVGNLTTSKSNQAGFNSTTSGYIIGGSPGSVVSIIEKILFPHDSGTTSHVGNLNVSRRNLAGFNSSTHGFCCAGYNGSDDTNVIERLTFPFNSGTASNVGNLSGSRCSLSGCNSSVMGYSFAGFIYPSGSILSIIDRLTFPFNSGTASNVGNLSGSRYGSSSINSSYYGYIIGGFSSVYLSIIDKITFPFDSGTASNVGNLTIERFYSNCFNSTIRGYICGGSSPTNRSNIELIYFPFDSGVSSIVGNLSQANYSGGNVDTTDFNGLFTE